jgi:hypothetical protein
MRIPRGRLRAPYLGCQQLLNLVCPHGVDPDAPERRNEAGLDHRCIRRRRRGTDAHEDHVAYPAAEEGTQLRAAARPGGMCELASSPREIRSRAPRSTVAITGSGRTLPNPPT